MCEKWWEHSVVYQVYPKSFNDTTGSGTGDLQGIIHKLDYLQKLGIDVIWLSPVYASPMKDNGYDISDYENIAEEFGTMAEMDALLGEAEQRGIKIIMDLVINHTSDQHAWFKASKSSRSHDKRDWYIWRDPLENGAPPNNLRSIFGGSCWTYDETTEQYYFHSFAKEQPDLNWENHEVREELFRMIRWWLYRGLGGFRVDAITFIKKPDLVNEHTPDSRDGTAIVKPNQPGVGAFLQEMKEKAFSGYDIFTVAEAPGVETEELAEFAGEDGFFDMLIGFDHVDLDIKKDGKWYPERQWTLRHFKQAVSKEQYAIEKSGWTALYLENHDQPRSLSRFIPEKDIGLRPAKMLAAAYFFLKGMPYIYQGQEIGMTNVKYAGIEDYDDISSVDQYHSAIKEGYSPEEALKILHRRSRDNSRTPMQWRDEAHAGFTSGTPWLAVNDNYRDINAEQSLSAGDSLFYFYQRLIHLRKHSHLSGVLTYGFYEEKYTEDENVFVYTRSWEGNQVVVLANFTDSDQDLDIELDSSSLVIGNYESDPVLTNSLLLRPYECAVFEKSV